MNTFLPLSSRAPAAWALAGLIHTVASAQTLPPVSVTATRSEVPPFDVPASIDVLEGARVRGDGRAQLNPSDSLTDRRYAGSVIVNEGSNRYFEPAAGRNHVVTVSANYRF